MLKKSIYLSTIFSFFSIYSTEYTGVVIGGKQEARKMGCPTANVRIHEHLDLPGLSAGVYYCSLYFPDKDLTHFTVLGYFDPTRDGYERVFEAHVVDYQTQDYNCFSGSSVAVRNVEKIRDPIDFQSLTPSEISEQIDKDFNTCRALGAEKSSKRRRANSNAS